MRPNTTVTKMDGNMQGQRVSLSVDVDSMQHLMGLLTRLYSDPALAVIREYSTNALDAQIEAGNDDPIKVTLPSDLNPVFTVQDKGVGLNVDDIVNVYSKYGASTKRQSNAVVGMLGVGCKSALAYTEQFTVEGIRSGVRTVGVVSRDPDKGAGITIVDTASTDEADGVTIKVPVRNVSEFNKTAEFFFKFWNPDQVLINGEPPKQIEGKRVGNTLITNDLRNDYVVMGNVPYRVPNNRLSEKLRHYSKVVRWVPIGSVEFTPSREELEMTDQTVKTITKGSEDVYNMFVQEAQQEIANADSKMDAIAISDEWSRKLFGFTGNYQGRDIPTYNLSVECMGIFKADNSTYNWDKVSDYSKTASLNVKDIPKTAVLLDFDNADLYTNNKAKIRKYLEQQNMDATRVIVTETDVDEWWLSDCPRITWDKVSKVSIGSKSSNSSTGETFRVYLPDGTVKVTTDPSEYPGAMMYTSGHHYSYQVRQFITQSLNRPAVMVHKNRWSKFEREWGWENIEDAIEKHYERLERNASEADLMAAHGMANRYLPPDQVQDPELARLFRLRQQAQHSTLPSRWREWQSLHAAVYDYRHPYPKHPDTDFSHLDNYPLIDYSREQDSVEYVNVMYATRKENR